MFYGKQWKIDGVIAGPIRPNVYNGRYTVVFERENASLEEIEAINWARPEVVRLRANENAPALPVGYGFAVVDITYKNNSRAYEVELKVADQYLGDVTGYQSQITELQTTVTAQAATIQSQQTDIESKEAAIQAQTATIYQQECTIQEQAAAIEELKEASGEALEAQLDAAYEEGVNSVE